MSGQDEFDGNEDGAIGGFRAKYVDVNGVRTRYYEAGENNEEPLLLIHGGTWSGMYSANTWTPVLSGLSEYFHVVAPDRLACGLTDNPTEESPYDWKFVSEVKHVRDFLDARGIEACHACGNSRGMASISWLATEHADRIKTIICTNSNTLSPTVGDYGHRRYVLNRGAPTDTDSPTYLDESLRHKGSVWAYDPSRSLDDAFFQAQAFMMTRPKAKRTEEVMESGGKETIERTGKFELMDDIRARLSDGAISQPILLYWGRHDLTATLEQGLSLYERISQGNPNVRMHIVDRAGHFPYRAFPDEFVQTVTAFADHWKDNKRSMDEVRPREYAGYYQADEEK